MKYPRRSRASGRSAAWLLAGFAAGYWLGRRFRQELETVQANRQIVNHVSEAIISADQSNTIVMANPAAAALFGTTVEQMVGSPLERYIESPDGDEPIDVFRPGSGRAGRRATDYTVIGLRGDGERFPIEGSISRTNDGAPFYTVVMRDVSERRGVQEKLTRSHDQLRQLSAALQTIREEERTHIARELHDDLGQLLASLRMDLTLLQHADGTPSESLRLMRGMEDNLLTAITSLRRIATNLRPRALDEGGLYFALLGLRDDFIERYAIPTTLLADEAELRLDDTASTAIFRIVQEALTNIARHAQATRVMMNLFRLNSDLLITIRDDGRGIRPEDMEKAESLGLIGMRERVWAMKGEITIGADEPHGTRIDIVLPLHDHLV
ncbi:PAS domain-containing sensor histidine kinase [Telluria mixta]|uniref:PAS domain-containing sensor histidine kinase n=1 Tax=Telluria mixta TaxID=34071 RepID=A0ABT2C6I3_9BURK|nr:PAS domain-containing sensor histidine kinase [Telluria mixta]MCS0633010.1 PAS domain-containing sensor histidine kinase [Telluria mixta]WEM96171.1 PAS domain-containing sensor histidine kinase [Telluria mixta]